MIEWEEYSTWESDTASHKRRRAPPLEASSSKVKEARRSHCKSAFKFCRVTHEFNRYHSLAHVSPSIRESDEDVPTAGTAGVLSAAGSDDAGEDESGHTGIDEDVEENNEPIAVSSDDEDEYKPSTSTAPAPSRLQSKKKQVQASAGPSSGTRHSRALNPSSSFTFPHFDPFPDHDDAAHNPYPDYCPY